MKRLLFLLLLLTIAGVGTEHRAEATAAWEAVNAETVQGTWLALDPLHGWMFLFQVKGEGASLVVTRGPKQSEYLFRSISLVAKGGKVLSKMKEDVSGCGLAQIKGSGRGNAINGFIKAKIVMQSCYADWAGTELLFVKQTAGSILRELIESEKRAIALADGSAKPNEPPSRTQAEGAARSPTGTGGKGKGGDNLGGKAEGRVVVD